MRIFFKTLLYPFLFTYFKFFIVQTWAYKSTSFPWAWWRSAQHVQPKIRCWKFEAPALHKLQRNDHRSCFALSRWSTAGCSSDLPAKTDGGHLVSHPPKAARHVACCPNLDSWATSPQIQFSLLKNSNSNLDHHFFFPIKKGKKKKKKKELVCFPLLLGSSIISSLLKFGKRAWNPNVHPPNSGSFLIPLGPRRPIFPDQDV